MKFKNYCYKSTRRNFIYDDTIYSNGSIILLKQSNCCSQTYIQANLICIGRDGKNYVLSVNFPTIKLIPLKYFIEITTNEYTQIDIFSLKTRQQIILDSQVQSFLRLMYNLEDIRFERDMAKFGLTYFSQVIFNEEMTSILRSIFRTHPVLYIYEKLGLFHLIQQNNYPVKKFHKILKEIIELKASYII